MVASSRYFDNSFNKLFLQLLLWMAITLIGQNGTNALPRVMKAPKRGQGNVPIPSRHLVVAIVLILGTQSKRDPVMCENVQVPSYSVTMLLCYYDFTLLWTILLCYDLTMLLCYSATLAPCHSDNLLLCYFVTMWLWYYVITLLLCGNLLLCYYDIILPCLVGTFMITNIWSSLSLVPGDWGGWSNWTDCSAACGEGTRQRSRECDSPAPANGGIFCPGAKVQTETCENEPCAGDYCASTVLLLKWLDNDLAYFLIYLYCFAFVFKYNFFISLTCHPWP